jgi:hypothetical protein
MTFSSLRNCALLCVSLLTACQTTAQAEAEAVPAVLKKADAASMDKVKSALAKSMGSPSVVLGTIDLTKTSVISAFPKRGIMPLGAPQNQAGNFALPTRFNMMIDGRNCYMVKNGTDEKILLPGVECKAALAP